MNGFTYVDLSALPDVRLHFYHGDHLGTPLCLTDAVGTVVWEGQYWPFGDIYVQDTDPDGDGKNVYQPFRFPGQFEDFETGLYYNYFRDYDPTLGRYIEADPIGIQVNINNYDIYGYSDGNTISNYDPHGLFSCNNDGSVDPCADPKSIADGTAAWAQYQFEKGNKDYTYDADTPSCGGSGVWKCNMFVRDALLKGGGMTRHQMPRHYVGGEKGPYFTMANDLANLNLNTDILGVGGGEIGNIVAWPSNGGSGHTGIIGCDGKIYNATRNCIVRWNKHTMFSWNQISRYYFTGRSKIYRSILE